MAKTQTLIKLKAIARDLRKKGKRLVFTNGCFDLLHPGHIKVLKEAKQKGDILIVAVNSDSSIKKIKGPSRPILKEKARIKLLEHIDLIDYIIIFKTPTPYSLIKALKPDVLVKGGDWQKKDIVGSDLVGQVHRVKLSPRHSTTAIIKIIKERS
ncbi:MAG: adenylyltransferase/cytidyltransferase family protein [Candidatus Omnitrophica bacterium]|nr:adenylyltransferase/cytidyltransferase family protein [Candidatus Omnitrophota bacterium]